MKISTVVQEWSVPKESFGSCLKCIFLFYILDMTLEDVREYEKNLQEETNKKVMGEEAATTTTTTQAES